MLKKLKCIDGLTLKIFAMLFMLCDHMWATVVPGTRILTDIGRLAFPIFAFQIVEAYFHTHSYKKLMLRLLAFAAISEIPMNLMSGGSIIYPFHQNVMFTFLIALLLIQFMEWGKHSGKKWKYIMAIIVSIFAGYILGTVTFVDYFGAGVLTVLLFYLCHGLRFGWIGQFVGMYFLNMILLGGLVIPVNLFGHEFEFPQQGFAIFSLIFIWLYNGKQGKHNKPIQYAYYAFYPLHMLILALISLYCR